MAVPHGVTMLKVANVDMALRQILADAQVPTSMTAKVLEEHDVSERDVMDVIALARDSIASFRNVEQALANGAG